MNITISFEELEALRKEVANFRTTRDLLLSHLADNTRYGTAADMEWMTEMLQKAGQSNS